MTYSDAPTKAECDREAHEEARSKLPIEVCGECFGSGWLRWDELECDACDTTGINPAWAPWVTVEQGPAFGPFIPNE